MNRPQVREVSRFLHIDSRDYIRQIIYNQHNCEYVVDLNNTLDGEYTNVSKVELKVLSYAKPPDEDYIIFNLLDVPGNVDSKNEIVQNCSSVCYFESADNVKKPIFFGGNKFEFNPLQHFNKLKVKFVRYNGDVDSIGTIAGNAGLLTTNLKTFDENMNSLKRHISSINITDIQKRVDDPNDLTTFASEYVILYGLYQTVLTSFGAIDGTFDGKDPLSLQTILQNINGGTDDRLGFETELSKINSNIILMNNEVEFCINYVYTTTTTFKNHSFLLKITYIEGKVFF